MYGGMRQDTVILQRHERGVQTSVHYSSSSKVSGRLPAANHPYDATTLVAQRFCIGCSPNVDSTYGRCWSSTGSILGRQYLVYHPPDAIHALTRSCMDSTSCITIVLSIAEYAWIRASSMRACISSSVPPQVSQSGYSSYSFFFNKLHMCSIGLKSGGYGGHLSSNWMRQRRSQVQVFLAVWIGAVSCWNKALPSQKGKRPYSSAWI